MTSGLLKLSTPDGRKSLEKYPADRILRMQRGDLFLSQSSTAQRETPLSTRAPIAPRLQCSDSEWDDCPTFRYTIYAWWKQHRDSKVVCRPGVRVGPLPKPGPGNCCSTPFLMVSCICMAMIRTEWAAGDVDVVTSSSDTWGMEITFPCSLAGSPCDGYWKRTPEMRRFTSWCHILYHRRKSGLRVRIST